MLHPSREKNEELCRDCRYLKVWCIAISLRGGAEASCTIGEVSYCLLGEGALDDVGVIAIFLHAGGSYTYTGLHFHTYTIKQRILVL